MINTPVAFVFVLLTSLPALAVDPTPAPPTASGSSEVALVAPPPTAGIVAGKWKTIDDETGEPKSIVEIFQEGDEVKGRIVELINPPEPDPKCKDCPGDKKDKPIQGLEIIWGMKETDKGKEWTGGKILDPKKGKVYGCRLRLLDEGKKLEVRGFMGFSLLGRSQTWMREL